MKALRRLLDSQAKHFEPGGKLERLYPLYEATDTFLYTPGSVTKGLTHVRDAADLKRVMGIVVVALLPAVAMAMYNTGLQAHRAIQAGAAPLANWQTRAMEGLGLAFDPSDLLACLVHGALYYLPIVVVTLAAGGAAEGLFASVRKHEINEGFLVTWMLFPLILPPTIPLWQVALGILFGVVIGKIKRETKREKRWKGRGERGALGHHLNSSARGVQTVCRNPPALSCAISTSC